MAKTKEELQAEINKLAAELSAVCLAEETEIEKGRQAAVKQIAEHVKAADAALDEACKLADKFQVGFHFSPGDAYGAGAFYEDGEWVSSSANC